MSKKFIAVSESKAEELKNELSGTIFKSPEDFVSLYNSEIINKKNDKVREVLDKVTEAFKNIKEQGSELVFMSHAEIALKELTDSLKNWEILTKVKRIVEDALESNEIQEGSYLAFSKNHNGFLLALNYNEDKQSFVPRKLSSEKVYVKFDEVKNLEASNILSIEDNEGELIFTAKDVVDLNESFLIDANDLIN